MKLNKILKERGITFKELGELTGIKKTTLERYSCGYRNLTVEAAKKIGKVLEIDWWLFFEDDKD